LVNTRNSALIFTGVVPSAISRVDAFGPYARSFSDLSGFKLPPDRLTPAKSPFDREYDSISADSCASVAALAERPTGPATTEASAGIRAQRHLVVQQLLSALFIHHDQYEVGRRDTCLKTCAGLRHFNEHGGTPRVPVSAAHHARPVFAADDEPGFLQ
jgi:hypothetical protein